MSTNAGCVSAPNDGLGIRPERVTLLESDLPKLVIAGQLSRRSSFQLRVDGHFDDKEQQALMRILTAQVDVLNA